MVLSQITPNIISFQFLFKYYLVCVKNVFNFMIQPSKNNQKLQYDVYIIDMKLPSSVPPPAHSYITSENVANYGQLLLNFKINYFLTKYIVK